jgi:LuxR family maltose regulon positive regulatory protein
VAPAGFGKTTLLTSWLAVTDRRVAWFSVEENEAGLFRFAYHMIAGFRQAVQDLIPDFGSDWHNANVSQDTHDIKALSTYLTLELQRVKLPLTLVIDDYHFITDDRIHKFVAEVIEKLPQPITFVISSRRPPALPLSRLRARGLLNEIASEHLRFTSEEFREFFAEVARIELSDEDIEQLYHYTEGWIVGIQLAAIGLQDGMNVADLVTSKSGPRRHSLVYLLEEVLERQPLEVQRFLIQTSILDRMTASLCDRVTATSSSDQIIKRLSMENLFIIPVDDDDVWFRYHHLFRTLLLERLKLDPTEDIRELKVRACTWYEENNHLQEAVAFAVSVSDWDKVVEMIMPVAPPLLLQTKDFRDWLRSLPAEAFDRQPTLGVLLAWSRLIGGNVSGCVRLLDRLERKVKQDDPMSVQIILMRLTVAWFSRTGLAGLEFERPALQLTNERPESRYLALAATGYIYMYLGDPISAEMLIFEAIELVRTLGRTYSELMLMFEIAAARCLLIMGRPADAMSALARIKQFARLNSIRVSERANITYAEYHISRNELHLAERELDIAGAMISQTGIEYNTPLYWNGIILLRLAQGNNESALRAVEEFSHWCKRNGNYGWLYAMETLHAVVLFEQGKQDDVGKWLQERTSLTPASIVYEDELRYLLLVRWILRAPGSNGSDLMGAYTLAGRLSANARGPGRIPDAAQAEILQALILQRLNRTADALTIVDNVAEYLLPEGIIRPFLEYADELRLLFSASGPELISFAGLIKVRPLVLQTDGPPGNTDASAPSHLFIISDREQDVLNLIAIGLTNVEIADSLVVSLNTVKTHIKNLYFKLDAHSRTQALAAARQSRLL